MKYLLLLWSCCITLSGWTQTTRRALFLGNSYTQYNNLPKMVADMAQNSGDLLLYDSNTPGGTTLNDHRNSSLSTDKIKAGNWDFIILQEQSQLPSFEVYNTYPAKLLCQLTEQYNPCARVLFYLTWGRQNGDAMNCPFWPPSCTYEGMDSMLRLNYTLTAQENAATLAPVGVVWRYIRQNAPGITLYDADGSHPSLAGSYLAATCFYTLIFRKDPSLLSFNAGMNPTDAATIRQAAKALVFDSLSNWEFFQSQPVASFLYSMGNIDNQVIFNGSVLHADSLIWDFGDGSFSNSPDPVHTYTSTGNFRVRLTAYNCDLDSVYTALAEDSIAICAHHPSIYPDNLVICPGSKDTLRTQVYDSYQWLDEKGDSIPGAQQSFLVPEPGKYYSVITTLNGCAERSAPVYVALHSVLETYYVNVVANFTGLDSLCQGDSVLLVLTPNKPPYPADSRIRWLKNGVLMTGIGNDSLWVSSTDSFRVEVRDTICPSSLTFSSQVFSYTFINCNSSTRDFPESNALQIYPNPAGEELTVISPQQTPFQIKNMQGELIREGMFTQGNNKVITGELAPGVYFLFSGNTVIRFLRQ